ncbi:MAG: glycosyltransferase family 2 protein [Bryobacteraceae bacterium]
MADPRSSHTIPEQTNSPQSPPNAVPVELAIVIPTFKERDNIAPLLESLRHSLGGIEYEIIFVDDDSPDGTAAAIRAISRTNPRVRVLQRIGRRGLSSACLEGMMATAAPYIAVMDADLQHDERILPTMLSRLKEGQLDLVVATRNKEGGGMGDFAGHRVRLSHLGRRLSRTVSHTDLSDPMSGFFVVDRGFLEEVIHSASGTGFKILLDLVASSRRPVRVAEVPYTFRKRTRGASKLDILVGIEYLQLLLDKTIGNLIPPRFFIFSMVGALGLVLSIGVLYVLFSVLKMQFFTAQAITTFVAMTANFFLNNSLTYRDRRLRGRRMWIGLATFYAACFVGAVVNVRIAQFTKDAGVPWYLAGACGLAVGAVWNYGVTSITTWRQARERPAKTS